jgi:hypothetical protein
MHDVMCHTIKGFKGKGAFVLLLNERLSNWLDD